MIEVHHEIDPIAREWDELASRVGASPFVRPGWFSRWWGAFGSGELSILALRREGRLSGVLPVCCSGRLVSSPTNWHTDLYGTIAEDAAARSALFAAVLESSPRRVDLSFLDEDSGDIDSLAEASGRYHLVSRMMTRSPFVSIEGDWDSYWRGLSKNLRSTVRRCHSRLEERGEVSFEMVERSDRLDELLDESFRLEATGWKGERGTAILCRPETLRFYRQTAHWAAEQGLLRLSFLRVDGQPVAFNLCLETEESHYLLKLGHDAKLDRLGPGTVLTAEQVARAFSLGLRTYEFMGGPDRYKLRWSNGTRELLRVQGFAPTPAGAIDRLIQTRGRAIAKKVLRRGS